MTLLLSSAALDARRPIANGALSALAASLAADLEPLLAREIHFPREKALLSRAGGRCARDGALLEFDPLRPHEHRCALCETVYRGEIHDRFWIYWYQLWLIERAVHASVLSALTGDSRLHAFAARILDGYVERYAGYPNSDNVLGPTRLFFSTYLESIWLLNVCIATSFLPASDAALAGRVRDRIIEPSRALIVEYDEGGSNRQVWNAAALLAAARLLDDSSAAERAVFGRSGVVSHLRTGLLADGTWFEGENYHLFAHRGLWYGVTMAECAGLAIPAELGDRFQRGFSTPFATALPDFTLPSRRDSQYAISLRQWRIAEHCELGVARRAEPALLAALAQMYDGGEPVRATGRDRSSADVERNAQPSRLTRADLSWRALLFARETLPLSAATALPSALLDAQGIAVFRRDAGGAYVALDYGHSGGGHGHPDRLNLLIADGDTRWLDDYGTGSYTDPSLHWYRSSLAHNAPFFDGKSQARVHGELLAYDESGEFGWVWAVANDVAPQTSVARSIVVGPGYLVDFLDWDSDRDALVDLPLHADLELRSPATPLTDAPLRGGVGLEDGFGFVRDTSVQISADANVRASATHGAARLDLFASSSTHAEWWRAVAPGPPSRGDRPFRLLRAKAAQGQHRLVWSWRGEVNRVELSDDALLVHLRDGVVHEHRRTDVAWEITVVAPSGRTRHVLAGMVDSPPEFDALSVAGDSAHEPIVVSRGPTTIEFGEAHYRRSEQSWRDAGAPRATLTLAARDRGVDIALVVHASDRTFVASGTENPFDNEPADVNGDGVQLYLRLPRGDVGLMLVPEAASDAVRVRTIDGFPATAEVAAKWRASAGGYTMSVRLDERPEAIDLIVNEKPAERARRRGQLVLSGGRGEFIYLRGDRHERERLIPLHFTP